MILGIIFAFNYFLVWPFFRAGYLVPVVINMYFMILFLNKDIPCYATVELLE
jgi:hypothetical protein